MKKLMMLAAMLAVVVVAAAPAIADVVFVGDDDPDDAAISQEFSESRITSGKASPSFSFSNSGNNVNACPTNQQIVNTGNVANEQGVTQYFTDTDDIDFSGSNITIEPSVTADCTQTIDQVAAA
jgi:hypothetical protein